MYLESQPERYKGFLSSDFSKTDEFSNTIRTEQYRDQLKVGGGFMHQMHQIKKSIPLQVFDMVIPNESDGIALASLLRN